MSQKNEVNLDQLLSALSANDESITALNLNSYLIANDDSPIPPTPDAAISIANALLNNTYVTKVYMSNANVNTEAAKVIAELLSVNKTITELNLETNSIAGDGILAIMESLKNNSTLTELKLTNQAKMIPSDVERAIAPAIESNTSLTKLVLSLREQSCRNAIDKIMFRNKDIVRKQRVAAKR